MNIEMTDKVQGRVMDTSQFRVSSDLQTLTITVHKKGQSNSFTIVYDRQQPLVRGQTHTFTRVPEELVWWSKNKRIPGGHAAEARADLALRPLGSASGDKPVCCGQRMERRFCRARDRQGRAVFVAVWECSRRGKLSA